MSTQAQAIINRSRSSLEAAMTCQEARADAVQDADGHALHCLPDGSVVLVRHDTCEVEAFPTMVAAYEALELIHAEKLATLILSEIPPLQDAMQRLIDAAEALCPGLLAAQVARAALAKASLASDDAKGKRWLFEHDDGRTLFLSLDDPRLVGDPQWHRVGPTP